MPIIGLTGPTGAGKGAVCAILRREGYGVVDTDGLAREVVKPGQQCLAQLVEAFSPAILRPDGTLDRQRLAALAFASSEGVKQLNAVTHPAIETLAREELKRFREQKMRGAVLDAPALYESGMERWCHTVWAVTAEKSCRLARLLQRDGLPEKSLLQRMAAQPPASFYENKANAVIYNNGGRNELEQQVLACLTRFEEEMADGAGS